MTNSHMLKNIFFLLAALVFGLACKAVSSFSILPQTTPTAPASPTVLASPTPSSPPSEGWIAFVNNNNVWLIHPDGNELKQVTTNPITGDNGDIKIRWSPDGQKLAFSQSSHLYVLDIATFTSTLLVDNTRGGFDWSVTSKQIIYDTLPLKSPDAWSDHGLWVVNLETGNKRQIVPPSGDNSGVENPKWSSEGTHLIYAAPGFKSGGYSIVDLTNGNIEFPLAAGTSDCEWSPNELLIACIEETPNSNVPSVGESNKAVLLDQKGNVLREFPLDNSINGNYWDVWSPDGKKLAIGYLPTEKVKQNYFRWRLAISMYLHLEHP